MNLLPHKSWNVWSGKNRARVERDQQQQRDEEEKKRKRQLEVEQEKRFEILKEKLKQSKESTNEEQENNDKDGDILNDNQNNLEEIEQPQQKVLEHVNLFSSGDVGELKERKPTLSLEKQKQKQEEDKLNEPFKLGYGSLELTNKKAWYNESQTKNNVNNYIDGNDRKKVKREKWIQKQEDPMTLIDKTLGRKSKENNIGGNPFDVNITTTTATTKEMIPLEKKKKKTIEELRAERLQREAVERERANKLTKKNTDNGDPQQSSFNYNVQYGGYSGAKSKR